MAGWAAGSLPLVAWAQAQRAELSVQATATATDNGNGGSAGLERADLLVSVHPRLNYRREGSGLRVRASLDADLVASARDTRDNRVLPGASIDARGTLVDRLLFVDASADVRQTEIDPFGARAESGSARNTRTAGTYRLSPTLEYEPSLRSTFLARYDVARTRYAGTTEGDVDTNAGVVRFAFKPRPVGAALEWVGEDTNHADVSGDDLRTDRLSAIASIALAGEWVLGASIGSERSELASVRMRDRTYGLRAYWVPGARTELAASVDRRFFGTGWNLSARHRTPRMSFALRALREPSTALNGPVAGNGLAGFLDAILTTRNPDASERQGAVEGLIASRGLPTSIQGASGALATYPQLRTGTELTWAYLGPRTTLSASLYAQELRQLDRSDGTLIPLGAATDDTRQQGAVFGWNRRLAPQLSLNMSAQYSQIEGLAVRAGERTREGTLGADVVRNLSPWTNLSAGVRVRRVSTNAANVNSFDETAGFVGLGHRF